MKKGEKGEEKESGLEGGEGGERGKKENSGGYHVLGTTCWARCITKQPRDLGVKCLHLPLAGEGSGHSDR